MFVWTTLDKRINSILNILVGVQGLILLWSLYLIFIYSPTPGGGSAQYDLGIFLVLVFYGGAVSIAILLFFITAILISMLKRIALSRSFLLKALLAIVLPFVVAFILPFLLDLRFVFRLYDILSFL